MCRHCVLVLILAVACGDSNIFCFDMVFGKIRMHLHQLSGTCDSVYFVQCPELSQSELSTCCANVEENEGKKHINTKTKIYAIEQLLRQNLTAACLLGERGSF